MHMGRDTHASGNSGIPRDQSLGFLLKKSEIIFNLFLEALLKKGGVDMHSKDFMVKFKELMFVEFLNSQT